jgi:hypothetical protein
MYRPSPLERDKRVRPERGTGVRSEKDKRMKS